MKIIDEVGNRHGKLLVIRYSKYKPRGKPGAHWVCICDCGQEVIVAGIKLRDGNNKSCGHLHTHPRGAASANTILGRYTREAKRKGIEWSLTKEMFLSITKQRCEYCNTEPSRVAPYESSTGGYVYNGIDRVDNKKGYVIGNVVTCCADCNWAKKERTVDEFLVWVERIWQHRLQ